VGEDHFALEWGGEEAALFWRVDWILTRSGSHRLYQSSCTIVWASPPYPSDHFPVVSELIIE
jgi:hypothetical protein